MDIKKTKNNRLFFDPLGDTEKVGKNNNKAKGFNRHSSFTGFFLSLMGLSFKDSDKGYLNKKSVVHYLNRNVDQLDLRDDEKAKIRNLSDNSTAKEVKDLFKKVKSSIPLPENTPDNPIDQDVEDLSDKAETSTTHGVWPENIPDNPIAAKFPDSLTIIGRYDRANDLNNKTIVRLMDGKTAYAANKVHPIELGPIYIVAESPKGSDAIYVDENWDEVRREKSEDKKYYYEMVWNESCPSLVSAADVYKGNDLDKDTFDFLAEGEEANFIMTSGENLSVKCISSIKDGSFEIRTLDLTSGDETKRTVQWILKGAFGYDNGGLVKAKTLYENLLKGKGLNWSDAQLIINCNTGKDRSAALIMWIELFHMLEIGMTIGDITHKNLQEIAKNFEAQTVKGGLTDHITRTLPQYYPDDSALQNAITEVMKQKII